MNCLRNSKAYLLIAIASCVFADYGLAENGDFDPLQEITNRFPGSIEFKAKGRVLEFCPDNTCDGFKAAQGVTREELREFAYLYIYFLSDYAYLREWREGAEARATSERVLSRPQYRGCRADSSITTARCALRLLSADGRIKLLFIRYDENHRNVVHRDLARELLEKGPRSKQ